jgi:hypothetical protein
MTKDAMRRSSAAVAGIERLTPPWTQGRKV